MYYIVLEMIMAMLFVPKDQLRLLYTIYIILGCVE